MRAGPLSEPGVISLLNKYFVPVNVSNEDYDEKGNAPVDEKKERDRIWRETLEKKLSAGTVHVYILSPDGAVIDSRHVANAAERGEVERLLERVVAELKTAPGEPLVKPAPQSRPKGTGPDDLVLHLVARGKGCSWDEFPSESWIVLSRAQWTKLLPARAIHPGETWDLDRDVAAAILTHFYPQTENNHAPVKRIDSHSLTASVVSIEEGRVRARISGRLSMKHDFYPGKDDGRRVEAQIGGYLDLDADQNVSRRIRSLRLITEKATYGPGTIEVAVRSVDFAR